MRVIIYTILVATILQAHTMIAARRNDPSGVESIGIIAERCKAGAKIIPHPTECHQYYNCSHFYTFIPPHHEQYLQKCPYPQLFSVESLKCEPFEKVECGNRRERVNGCDYLVYMCDSPSCVPCEQSMPSCEGKPDGINAHDGLPWSTYFITCYKGRLMDQDTCRKDTQSGDRVFHPIKNKCVPLDQVPEEYGGTMRNCSGKADGFYPDGQDRCHQYTECQGGKVLAIHECPPRETFDRSKRACVNQEKACPPCGYKENC